MKAFDLMIKSLNLSDEEVNKPMTNGIYENPYSPQVQLIMNLYSMEPSFYADLKDACKNVDQTKIETLGPFARALFGILRLGQYSEKKKIDYMSSVTR